MELHPAAPDDLVHVRYRLTDALDAGVVQRALALLSPDELERHERFRADRDRREFAVAHGLLRATLSEFGDVAPTDWRFAAGAHGKPALAQGVSAFPLSFSLSHAHGLVACLVARDADVGVDVELVARTRDWRSIASRYFAAEDRAQIDRAPEADQAARFFELWTLKEAFAKAVGLGLPQALGAVFEVADGRVSARTLPHGADPAAWHFALYTPASGHRLAVAVSDGSVRRWRVDVKAAAAAERE